MTLGFILLGFLSGSILYSALLPRILKGIDVQELAEDHNPGAANAFQYGGKAVGLLSLGCDLAKAYFPVHFALHVMSVEQLTFGLVLAAPVLGHAFSPFAHFKGGKAIAAAFGVLLAVMPQSHVIWHLVFWYILFSTLILIRPHAIRSILVFALTALYALTHAVPSIAVGTTLIALTISWKHLPSIHSEPFSLYLLGKKLWPRRDPCRSFIDT